MFAWIKGFRVELAIIVGVGMLIIGVNTMGWRIVFLIGIIILGILIEVGDAIFLRTGNTDASDNGNGSGAE